MFVVRVISLFVLVAISSVFTEKYISDEDYQSLPPIFHIDPYEKCLKEKKKFCRVSLKLSPSNIKLPSTIWQIIEKTKKHEEYYNHDNLLHAICIKNNNNLKGVNTTEIFIDEIAEAYTKKYKTLGLKANVIEINCKNTVYHTGIFDLYLMLIIVFYLLVIFLATVYDLKSGNSKKCNKYIILFSCWHNLKKLNHNYQKTDVQRLKCIQGIRFYTTVLIIFCHTFCSFAGGFIANTSYLETFSESYFKHALRNVFVFLVQTFFLISAWLLSYHTFKIFEVPPPTNYFRYVGLTLCNRYLRIIPPVLLMVPLGTSTWIYGSFYGPVKEIYSDEEYQRCQRNWWTIFLFINNHYKRHDMCYFITWYLAADTQLYALSLIILMIILKYKDKVRWIFISCIFIGIVIPAVVTYIYQLDIIYRFTPENSKNNMLRSFKFSATYSSTYCNMATYMLGLAFGYLYFKFENKRLFNRNSSLMILWWCSFIAIPFLVIVVSSYRYDRATSALLVGILRPTWALGVGIGIFGMCQQIGGFAKKICEWKPAVFLGNITYSTYVVHFGIVFSRTALASKPMFISDFILFTSFVRDITFSFICGFVLHLLLEMPLSQLQNMLIPKYKISSLVKSCDIRK